MPYDFSAKQVKSGKLIASGGLLANKNVGLMIYSASDSTNKQGGIPAAMTANVGSDVFLFVSGAKDGKQSGYGRVTLFGGDLAVSGTLYAEKMIVEINEITTGSLFVSGGLEVSQSIDIEGYKWLTNASSGKERTVSLHFPSTSGEDYAGRIVWDNFDASIHETGGNLFLSSSGDTYMYIGGGGGNSDLVVSGVGHTAVQIISDSVRDGNAAVKFNVAGSTAFALGVDDGDSDKFKISPGSINGASTFVIDSDNNVGIGTATPTNLLTVNGDANITGDLTVSDDVYALSNLNVSGSMALAGDTVLTGDLTVSDDVYALSAVNVSGSLSVANDTWITDKLNVSGSSALAGAVLIGGGFGSTGVTINSAGDINADGALQADEGVKIGNNALTASDGGTPIIWDTSDNVTIAGDLTVTSNDIGGSGGTAITFSGLNTFLAGDLKVTGNDIQSSDGLIAITLSKTDITVGGGIKITNNAITASDGGIPIVWDTSDNVTVAGDLTINGNDIGGSSGTAITFSGLNTFLAGDLKVTGNDIQSSAGLIAITLSNTDVTVGGGIKVTNNAITASDGGIPIVWDTSDNVTIAGDLTVNGNDIKKSGGGTAITMTGTGITIAGDLKIDGNDILSNSGLAAITLSKTDVISLGGIKVTNNAITASNGITPIVWDTEGDVTFGAGIKIASNAITASDGGTPIVWDTGDNVTIAGDLTSNENIYTLGTLNASGSAKIANDIWVTDKANISGTLAVNAPVIVSEYIKHMGDLDTLLRFQTDSVTIDAGGVSYLKASATETSLSINPDNSAISTTIMGPNKLGIGVSGTADKVLILSGGNITSTNEAAGADVAFYVSGSTSSHGTTVRGTSLLGGDVVMSGSTYCGSILPLVHNTYNLGSNSARWANLYTGDLHLQNEKGNWTIQEDFDKLIVINNLTGKRYKMALEPLEDDE